METNLGQPAGNPPIPPPSTAGAKDEKGAPAPSDQKPPETLAAELDADEQKLKAEHGDSWAIKEYRKLKKTDSKYKDIRQVADRIGNAELLRDGLRVVETLGDPTVDIREAKADLRQFDTDRYNELRNDFYAEFVDNYADHVLSDILGESTSVADVKKVLAGQKTGGKASTTPKSGAYKAPDDLRLDYPEVADELERLQAKLAEQPESKVVDDGKSKELQKQLDNLKTERQREEYLAEVQSMALNLYNEVFDEVGEVAAELGLAPDKDDPDDLASLKEAALDYITDRARVESQFDSVEENVKLVSRATEHLSRKQEKRAREYLPSIKIAARKAAEDLAGDRKGKALLDAVGRELQRLSASGKTKPGGKQPIVTGGTPSSAQAPQYVHGKGDDDLWDQMEARVAARRNG